MRKDFMKKSKSAVALLLAGSMLFSMTACGNNAENNEVGGDSTQEQNTAVAGTEEKELTQIEKVAEYFSDYPAYDLGGRTIRIGVFYDCYYDSTHTVPEDNPNVTNIENAQLSLDNVRRIEEKYNCRIEYVNPGSEALINSLNTSVVAGTPDYDVYLTQTWFGLPLALNGYFYDIDDLASDYSKVSIDQAVIKTAPMAGTNCFFETSSLGTGGRFMVYNKDILAELNLEDPNELYAKGEWTWDKFAEICKAATLDTDNNGETDIYGYCGGVANTFQEFLASNNAHLIKDGTKENLSDPAVLETFNFLSKIYYEDKSGRPMTEDYNDNAFAFTTGKGVFSVMALWILQSSEISFDYGVCPWPVGPSGDGSETGMVYNDYWVIPKGVENPEMVLQVVEEFFGTHAGDLELRDEGSIETIESILLSEEDVEIYKSEIAKAGTDAWSLVDDNTGYVISGIFNSIITGEMTPAQAVETGKLQWQAALDSIFGSAD